MPTALTIRPRATHMLARQQARPASNVPRPWEAPHKRGLNYGGGFASAAGGSLYGDFGGAWGEINNDLVNTLPKMRARSRQLYRDNEYAQAYVRAMLNNVFGSEGIHFEMKVRDPVLVKSGKKTGGELDTYANKTIEEARQRFERKENYTVSRDLSRLDAQKLYATCAAVDGEAFIRKVRGADNPFQYANQLIPPDLIPIGYNDTLANGNKVVMGKEFDQWNACIAIYVKKMANQGVGSYHTNYTGYTSRADLDRVPAGEITHLFKKEFANQVRGIPWLQPAAQRLHMLAAFVEAAVVNARVGATKMGFFKKTTPEGFWAEIMGKSEEEIAEMYPGLFAFGGGIVDNPEPGQWVELPQGVEPVPWTPNYPDAQFGPFIQEGLRGVAAALGVSYATLSNDLSQNSFSSSRVGLNEEREQWKMLQTWFIENFCQPEFEAWLYMALATRQIALPIDKIEKYNSPVWGGRRWSQVNPLQDRQAQKLALEMGLTTKSKEAREGGVDYEDLVNEAGEDNLLEKAAGVANEESLRFFADAYGVGVRAGLITPCAEDEVAFRQKVGLPEMPKAVADAWKESGGVRSPITLTPPEETAPNADKPVQDLEGDGTGG